jgi:hypothetical protein
MDGASVQLHQLQLLQQQQQRQSGLTGYGSSFLSSSQYPSLLHPARGPGVQDFYPEYTQYPATPQPNAPAQPSAILSRKGEAVEAPPSKSSKTAKKNEKAGSTYASRHQAAESRRRQRINDRCMISVSMHGLLASLRSDARYQLAQCSVLMCAHVFATCARSPLTSSKGPTWRCYRFAAAKWDSAVYIEAGTSHTMLCGAAGAQELPPSQQCTVTIPAAWPSHTPPLLQT